MGSGHDARHFLVALERGEDGARAGAAERCRGALEDEKRSRKGDGGVRALERGLRDPPPGANGDQFILTALKRGDMAIEVHGMNKDAVASLGKAAVSRLK